MTNLEFDIPKDKGFEFVPDNAIIFGGAVRDVIRGKEINDIDLLFNSEEELNEFIYNVNVNKNSTNLLITHKNTNYSDLTYSNNNLIHKIVSFTFNGKDYKFDCLAPKDPNKAFISDFDVNSLFAVKKDNKLVVSGTVFKYSPNKDSNNRCLENLVKDIHHGDDEGMRYAFPIFNKKASYLQEKNRSRKINKNGFVIHTNGHDGYNHTDDQFLTIKEMFEAAFTNMKKHCKDHDKHDDACVYCIDEDSEIISQKEINSNKEEKMTTKPNPVEWLKKNAEEGAYAGMAASATNNLAETFVKTAEANNLSPEALKLMKDAFESKLGKAGLSFAIGTGIHFIPVDAIQGNKHIQKVADKCVQNAASEATEEAINTLLGLVLPAIMGAINTSPQLQAIEKLNALSAKEDDIEEPVAENVSKLSVRLK